MPNETCRYSLFIGNTPGSEQAIMAEKQSGGHSKAQLDRDLRAVLPILSAQEETDLTDIISQFSIEVAKEPETGLIMVRACDCFDLEFNLGEVLVTTAEVSCDGNRTHATIMGNNQNKALLAAAVGAMVNCNLTEALVKIAPIIETAMTRLSIAEAEEDRLTAATKVNFESMAEET
jgi:phosphonate C-P lyase system protein PhnG